MNSKTNKNTFKGQYIGKNIGDYVILDKKRENGRTRYFIECTKCGVSKWVSNIKNYEHGGFCDGLHRKTGSKLIGKKYGDYVVISKNIKNNRSSYILKCSICDSIKEVYNLQEFPHGEHCKNFSNYIKNKVFGDYTVIDAYKEDRIYVDLKCAICGRIRKHICYKDIKNNKGTKHVNVCPLLLLKEYPNKKIVHKLFTTLDGIKHRVGAPVKGYEDVENKFLDSVEFVDYMYPMYEERLREGKTLRELSIDRINPFGNYEKGNVRCLTMAEQQKNKRIHYKQICDDVRLGE